MRKFTFLILISVACHAQQPINPGSGGVTITGCTDATCSTYTAPFTGAAPQTQAAKNGQTVSVMDYGAKGDGATDDTASWVAAIAAIPATGGLLNCPTGNYKISSTLLITTSNFKILGSRGGLTAGNVPDGSCNLLWAGATATPMMKLQGVYQDTIDGVNFDGNNTSGATGLLIYSTNSPTVQRTTITNIGMVNMGLSSVPDGICIDYEGTTVNNQADGNVIDRFSLRGCQTGIRINLKNFSYSEIRNGGIVGNTFAIDLANVGNVVVDSVSFATQTTTAGSAPTDCSVGANTIPAFILVENQHSVLTFINTQGETGPGYSFRVLPGGGGVPQPITFIGNIFNLPSSFDGFTNATFIGQSLATNGPPLANICWNNGGTPTVVGVLQASNPGSGGLPALIPQTGVQGPLNLFGSNSAAFFSLSSNLAIPDLQLACPAGVNLCHNPGLLFSNPDATSAQNWQLINSGPSGVMGNGGFGVYDGITGNIPLKIDPGALNGAIHITSSGVTGTGLPQAATIKNPVADCIGARANDNTIQQEAVTGASSTATAITVTMASTTGWAVGMPVGVSGATTITALNVTGTVTGVVANTSITFANTSNPCSTGACGAIGGSPVISIPISNSTDAIAQTQFATGTSITGGSITADTSWKGFYQLQSWSSSTAPAASMALFYAGTQLFSPTAFLTAANSLTATSASLQFHMLGLSTTSVLSTLDFINLYGGGTGSALRNSIIGGVTVSTSTSNLIPSIKWAATGVASGTYTSGITATGTTGQTCLLTAFNGTGGTAATASVALTGTNTIAGGTALVITNTGSGYTGTSTSATVGPGTASACTGPATIVTVLGGAQGNAVCQLSLLVGPGQ